MTLIIDHRPPSGVQQVLIWLETSLVRATEAVAMLRKTHANHRTAREIADLPFDLRKDIGWPARDIEARGTR